jgi:apolipoprotein N-acyltransferase
MATTAVVQTKQVPQVAGLTRIGIGAVMGLLSAALLIFAFQPHSLWPLAFFAYVPMLVAAYRIVPRRWAGLPGAIGLGGWLGVSLTALFGLSPETWFFPAIAVLIAVISFISEPGVRLFHERTNYRWFVLQGAINVVGVEMIRSFIPPINTHFFMVQTAYTQPWLLQPISIFSIYGLSLLIMLVNYALARTALAWIDHQWHWSETPAITLQGSLRWLAGVGIALVVWSGIGVTTLATAPKNAPMLRVAAIQHGFLKPSHQDPGTQAARLQVLSEQTREAAAKGAKLMVWPELGLGFDPQIEHTAELKALAAETNAYLIIGYGISGDPRGWRNEAVMLTPGGEFLQVYGKNHSSSPGEPPIVTAGAYPVYDTPIGRIATVICNDVNFTDTSRKLALNGAQIIAVPTYETVIAGFHWEMPVQGVLRAVENRVATVKSDTAFSALIADPYGRILARRDGAPNGEAFALVADVPLETGNTLTTRVGDWMGWVCLAGLIFFTVLQNMKGKTSKVEK